MNRTSTCLLTLLLATVLVGITPSQANGQGARTPTLYEAAARGDVDVIQQHIANGADLNEPDSRGRTALGHAANAGRLEAVTLLAKSGANVNAPSADVPPLVIAALQRRADIVTVLVENAADVNAKDTSGRTTLIVAAENGQKEIVDLLVAKGADVNSRDNRGTTPLTAATRGRHSEVAQLLREHGATEPVSTYDRDPYGRPGMPQGTQIPSQSAPSRAASVTQSSVLADPNAIRANIASHEGLAEALQAVDANAAPIERSWASRRSDNRTTIIRAIDKQFKAEMTLVSTIAKEEQATETVVAVKELVAKRQARYKLIGSDLREARRLAQQEARAMTTRGRGRGGSRRSRGRSNVPSGADAYGDPTQGGDPYGTRPPRSARTEDVPEEAVDPETENQRDAWLAANFEDKRSLLAAVHELNLLEYDALRQVALGEEAKKTAAALEGLMLARQGRVERVLKKMAAEDERLQRMAERYGTTPGATRSRRGRGATQQGDAATQRNGRYAP